MIFNIKLSLFLLFCIILSEQHVFFSVLIFEEAKKHSSKGSFGYSKDGRRQYKMLAGGHGQENIRYLRSRNIPHDVVFEYENGVRRGNVSIHKRNNHRNGDMQCWFPKGWSQEDIAEAGRHVMSLKENKKRENQKTYWGMYRKVKVGVKTQNGYISTIFPNYVQKGEKKYVKK